MSTHSTATPPTGKSEFIPVEPSRIANVNPQTGHGVTEEEGQQAATAPGTGEVVGETTQVPFKEQVNGYAKIIAGKVFRNKDEVEFGEKKLDGEI